MMIKFRYALNTVVTAIAIISNYKNLLFYLKIHQSKITGRPCTDVKCIEFNAQLPARLYCTCPTESLKKTTRYKCKQERK